jgi:hypothetical protein
MGKGSLAHVLLATTDLRAAKDRIKAVLDRAGFRSSVRSRGRDGFIVQGIRGSDFKAWLGQQIPFGALFGLWSKVGAAAKGQRSLDEGDDRFHLWIRVWPVRELSDDRETWWTRDLGEAIGDHRQCRKVFAQILEELDAAGLLAPLPREERRMRERAPRRRRRSRR